MESLLTYLVLGALMFCIGIFGLLQQNSQHQTDRCKDKRSGGYNSLVKIAAGKLLINKGQFPLYCVHTEIDYRLKTPDSRLI